MNIRRIETKTRQILNSNGANTNSITGVNIEVASQFHTDDILYAYIDDFGIEVEGLNRDSQVTISWHDIKDLFKGTLRLVSREQAKAQSDKIASLEMKVEQLTRALTEMDDHKQMMNLIGVSTDTELDDYTVDEPDYLH